MEKVIPCSDGVLLRLSAQKALAKPHTETFFEPLNIKNGLSGHLLKRLVLILETLDLHSGRISLGIDCQSVLPGFPKSLEPLIVQRLRYSLPPAQMRDWNLPSQTLKHNTNLVISPSRILVDLEGNRSCPVSKADGYRVRETICQGMNKESSGNRLKRRCTVAQASSVGYRVLGTIKAVKGYCHAGHQTGDEIELNGHNAGGLCGFLYHQAFPYIIMLQIGGGFPSEWGNPDIVELDCMDKTNAVSIELRRIRA